MVNFLFKTARATMASLTYEAPQMALKRLHDEAPVELKKLLTVDRSGNTILHRAAMKLQGVSAFERDIQSVGEEAAVVLAKMCNDQGLIPLQIAASTFQDPEREAIPAKILSLTIKHNSKPLHERVDEKEVLSRYADKPMSKRLRENLVIGCAVVNIIRDLKLESITHPRVNDMDGDAQFALSLRIDKMRRDSEDNASKILDKMADAPFEEIQRAYIKNQALVPVQHGVGNCGEFAWHTLYTLINQFEKSCAKMHSISGGDHAMNTLGERSDDKVVCDSHAGDVYPASEIPKRMTCGAHGSSYLDSEKKLLDWLTETSFNPKFHHVKLRFSSTYNGHYVPRQPGASLKK